MTLSVSTLGYFLYFTDADVQADPLGKVYKELY